MEGYFFFRFLQDGGCAGFSLRPGLVPEEFYAATEDLHHGRGDPEAAEARALELRRAIASAIRSLDPSELFVVHEARAAEPLPEGNEPPPLEEAGSLAFRFVLPGREPMTFVLKERYVPHEYFALCERKAGAPGVFGEEPERRRLQLEFVRLALSEPELFEVVP